MFISFLQTAFHIRCTDNTRMYREKFRSHEEAQVKHGEKKWEITQEDLLPKVYQLVYSGDTKCIYALVHETTIQVGT